jgi:hypothetical protein
LVCAELRQSGGDSIREKFALQFTVQRSKKLQK